MTASRNARSTRTVPPLFPPGSGPSRIGGEPPPAVPFPVPGFAIPAAPANDAERLCPRTQAGAFRPSTAASLSP
jgi:hypothetical protein